MAGAALALALTTACSESEKPYTYEPLLEVLPATGVTRAEATLRGIVTLRGNTEMPLVAFHYTQDGGTEQTLVMEAGASGDTLVARLDHLTHGADYYWYMTTDNGRVRLTSDTVRFATEPNVRPQAAPLRLLSAGPISMILAIQVTDTGGEPLTALGCYVREQRTGILRKVEADITGGSTEAQLHINALQPSSTYELWGYAANTTGEALTDTLTYSTGNTFVLNRPGQLAELMEGVVCETEELAFSGPLNGDDLRCLRSMMGRDSDGNGTGGRLVRADLTETDIIADGTTYDHNHLAQNGTVGARLFAGLDQLEWVRLPASATTIEENAFEGCSSLHEIVIPASVTSVGQSRGCTALERIGVDGANRHFTSTDGVLLDASATQIVWFPMGKSGDYTLPSTVTSIGDYAFRQCSITHFTLPDALREIGKGAFSHSLVEEVQMPAHLATLPTGTFQGCTRLKVVRLGEGLELVSDYAFDGCALEHIYIEATLPPYCNSHAFASSGAPFTPTCCLHVPRGCKTRYRSSQGWKEFAHFQEIP